MAQQKKGRPRNRKAEGARTLAVAVYQQEIDILEKAMEMQKELGSRASISSCLRYAIHVTDWEKMPPIY